MVLPSVFSVAQVLQRAMGRIACQLDWLWGQAPLAQSARARPVSGSSPRPRWCPSPPGAGKIAGLAIAVSPDLHSVVRPHLLYGRDRRAQPPGPGSRPAAKKHAPQKIVTE